MNVARFEEENSLVFGFLLYTIAIFMLILTSGWSGIGVFQMHFRW